MTTPLNVLFAEDSQNDVDLILEELRHAGFDPKWKRVQTDSDFLTEIKKLPDIILSDYSMPQFTGLQALKLLRESELNIPFILISGTAGEQIAVEVIKSGATDYLLKDRIARLGSVVAKALEDKKLCQKHQQAEEALHEAERRLRIVFNKSVLGIALVAMDGRPVLANAALQKMLGYTDEELSRMHFIDFTHPDDRAADVELYRQLRQGTRTSYQIEKRYIRKDGQVVWGRLSVSAAGEAKDRSYFAIGMLEDVTERRNLEAKFIEAQKMEVVGQLAGGVAHDFNNIIAIIMGYSELMMEKLQADDALKSDVEAIRHAAERASALTRQLLIFSRKQTVQPIVLDISEVVSGMEKMLRRLIDENIELTFKLGKEIGRIKADPGHVGQVLMNLVVNARDAMLQGGRLTVETQMVILDEHYARLHKGVPPGHYVLLTVTDTGAGMCDEVKAHLFEPFFTTKPKNKGTGLGLATCQTIVQQCGGHITVDSEVGRGAAFKIYFPRFDLPLALAADPSQKGPLPRGTETVLIVEDDPNVRHLAQKVLEGQGYEVLRATNGQDALRVVREHTGSPTRLVVTDVVMPQMGGKVMAEWLKSTYPDIKILFTSGYTDDALAHHGVLDDGVDFLPKPYTPSTLARKVREMLDAR